MYMLEISSTLSPGNFENSTRMTHSIWKLIKDQTKLPSKTWAVRQPWTTENRARRSDTRNWGLQRTNQGCEAQVNFFIFVSEAVWCYITSQHPCPRRLSLSAGSRSMHCDGDGDGSSMPMHIPWVGAYLLVRRFESSYISLLSHGFVFCVIWVTWTEHTSSISDKLEWHLLCKRKYSFGFLNFTNFISPKLSTCPHLSCIPYHFILSRNMAPSWKWQGTCSPTSFCGKRSGLYV